MKSINVTDLRSAAKELSAGDSILLSGIVYTARDAAHKRLTALIADGGELPFPLEGSCIYYAGPTPPHARQSMRFVRTDDLLPYGRFRAAAL